MSNEFILILFFGALLILLIALGVQGLPAPLPMLRLFLGLAYVLYVPGYTLQAALFPRADDLDGPERLALSFGLSVAVIPPLALLLDALPWGIRLWPIVISEATLIALCSMVALLRRRRLPEEERFVPTITLDLGQWWAAQTRISRLLYVILALALLGAGVAATAIIVTPKPGERLTEFYILGPEGLAENYPREAVVGFPVTVTVGIANHEGVPADYWVGVYCGDHLIGQSEPLHLEHGQTDERVLGFVPIQTGDNVRIDFYLYRDGGTQPYRSLRLWLKVKSEAEKQ
ncbi:MAG: DUF1616 domain-containing protein [Chloroflexi bacterium]|nr:DUF1616 domain-containing protein [Chloroflexota bacterium]